MAIQSEWCRCRLELVQASHFPGAVSKFIGMYALGIVPNALIVTYAGSISTLEKPTPAIITAIIVSSGLWLMWFLLAKRVRLA